MTDEIQLANSIALLEEAMADRRRLEQELGAARADNTALHRALDAACGLVKGLLYDDGTDAAIKRAEHEVFHHAELLAQPHPGAALLQELENLRSRVRDLEDASLSH